MGNKVCRVEPPTQVVKYWRFSRVSTKHFGVVCHNSCSYTGQTNAVHYLHEFEGALKGGVCLFGCLVQISTKRKYQYRSGFCKHSMSLKYVLNDQRQVHFDKVKCANSVHLYIWILCLHKHGLLLTQGCKYKGHDTHPIYAVYFNFLIPHIVPVVPSAI